MTPLFCDFQRLPPERQLDVVFATGALVATQWDSPRFVHVYDLPGGFFAGVAYDASTGRVGLVWSAPSWASQETNA